MANRASSYGVQCVPAIEDSSAEDSIVLSGRLETESDTAVDFVVYEMRAQARSDALFTACEECCAEADTMARDATSI
jgi:hypothetical protein